MEFCVIILWFPDPKVKGGKKQLNETFLENVGMLHIIHAAVKRQI